MTTTDPATGVLVIGQIARDFVLRVEHWPPSSGSARVAERRQMLGGRAPIRRSLRDISGRRCSCSASPGPTGRGRRRGGPRPAAGRPPAGSREPGSWATGRRRCRGGRPVERSEPDGA
ncbi:ribokinase [Brachybacterium sp. SW0106-09]|nr:ribokinase [Brachybacterium sp. SW0106-09]